MFRTYVESFLGRPAKNLEDMTNLCLTVLISDAYGTQIAYGNKTVVTQTVMAQDGGFLIVPIAEGAGIKGREFF